MEEEKRLVAQARADAIQLSQLAEGVVFYEREVSVIVRNRGKLIELLKRLQKGKTS